MQRFFFHLAPSSLSFPAKSYLPRSYIQGGQAFITSARHVPVLAKCQNLRLSRGTSTYPRSPSRSKSHGSLSRLSATTESTLSNCSSSRKSQRLSSLRMSQSQPGRLHRTRMSSCWSNSNQQPPKPRRLLAPVGPCPAVPVSTLPFSASGPLAVGRLSTQASHWPPFEYRLFTQLALVPLPRASRPPVCFPQLGHRFSPILRPRCSSPAPLVSPTYPRQSAP